MRDIDIYVNQDDALKRMMGNRKLFQKLLQSFIDDSLLDTLIAEIGRGDVQLAAKTAHAIKGASANLSLIKLHDTVHLLESGLKNGTCDKDALQSCLDAFDKTKEAINKIVNCY